LQPDANRGIVGEEIHIPAAPAAIMVGGVAQLVVSNNSADTKRSDYCAREQKCPSK